MTDLLLLPGDGIGPEVTAQVRRVAARIAPDLTLEERPFGGISFDRHGVPLTDETLAAHAESHGDHAHGVVEEDAMWGRLEALPPRQRTVLVLRYYEGLSDAEISEVLGTSPATVRSHASRALATLRDTDLSTRPEMR